MIPLTTRLFSHWSIPLTTNECIRLYLMNIKRLNTILNTKFFVYVGGRGRINIIIVYTHCMFYDFGPYVADFSITLLEDLLYLQHWTSLLVQTCQC